MTTPTKNNASHLKMPEKTHQTTDEFINEFIDEFIAKAVFNEQGLIPAIAQDVHSQTVLMMAWMNADSLRLTLEKQEMVYYSRSRQQLWHKGETSGHTQKVHRIMLDCDADALLAQVEQIGGIACHTGRNHCFFQEYTPSGIKINTPVIKSPTAIYSSSD